MTPCPPRDRLGDLLAERLPAGVAAAVERHVESCPACQAALAGLLPAATPQAQPGAWEPGPTFLHRLRAAGSGSGGPPTARPLPEVPGYDVIRVVGRGGMGVVYEAVQVGLGRRVALKMLRDAPDAQALARFRREAAAVARLNHPNVVRIYDVGEHDGRPYFAMELVEGGSLAARLRGQPCPPREAAAAAETLARAAQAAHALGIIHRDLKPANILLQSPQCPVPGPQSTARGSQSKNTRLGTGDGGLETLKLGDFGLARDIATGSDLTETGQVMGTPGYMAPEQAGRSGGPVGPPADVYALGAVLYELLTGRPPFAGSSPVETILQVLSADPVPPRRLNPAVPKDLETIALKCLEKDPARRYPSAGALADDLAAYLADRPIRARPVGAGERAWRWCRRNPAQGLAAALAVLLLAGGTIAALTLAHLERRHAAGLAAEKTETEGALAKLDANYLLLQETDRGRRRALVNSALLLQERAQAAGEAGEVAKALLLLDRALEVVPADEVTARGSLHLYAAAWRPFLHPVRATIDAGEPVTGLVVGPDGSRWATCSSRGDVALWDSRTGRRVGPGPPRRVFQNRLLFSPDGRHLLTASLTGFALRDTRTGAIAHDVPDIGTNIQAVAFAPDSGRFLTVGLAPKDTGTAVETWDVATGKSVAPPIRLPAGPGTPIFTPDGRVRLLGLRQGRPATWDPEQPGPVGAAGTPPGMRVVHHPRSPFAGTASGSLAILWREQGGTFTQTTVAALVGEVRDLCFTADGGHLLALSARRLSILAVPGGRPPVLLDLPAGEFDHVVPAAAGTGFTLTGPAGVLVGDAVAGAIHHERVPYSPLFRSPHFQSMWLPLAGLAPDGTLVLAEVGSTIRARATAPYGPARQRVPVAAATDPVFSLDGRHLILAEPGRGIRFWDRQARRMADESIRLPAEAVALALRPDRPELLAWTTDGEFSFFDLGTRERVGAPVLLGDPERDPRRRPARGIEFSPDGRQWLAFGDRWVWVWDVGTRERVAAIRGGPSVDAATFSPDGRWIAYAGMDGRVCFWDRRAAAPDPLRLELGRPVSRIRFSADGARVVCLVMDGTVETWELAGRRRVGDVPALGGRSGIGAIASDPAGRFVSAGHESVALIDPATGKQVGPLLKVGDRVEGMAVDAAGRSLAVRTPAGTEMIDLPAPTGDDAGPAAPSTRVLTGLSLDERGTLIPLTVEAWTALRPGPGRAGVREDPE